MYSEDKTVKWILHVLLNSAGARHNDKLDDEDYTQTCQTWQTKPAQIMTGYTHTSGNDGSGEDWHWLSNFF